jgi:RND family efflux transporter MFP subunit
VTRASLTEIVTGPGRTAALVQQKVRAPFAGTLTELHVIDGDPVQRGQVLGTIVSRESEAALSGARAMVREARSGAEKQDAERALTLAEKNLVHAPLRASADGTVLSHSASQGDRVSEDQEILTIEDASSIVFLADIPQGELPRIRPGQNASLEIGGGSHPVPGVVHGVLPNANPADFTAPVRIDLRPGSNRLALGLFGTARIIVGRRENVLVLPDSALLRDDVTGVARVAAVREGRAHWLVVTTGLRESGRIEITSGNLSETDRVVVSGQVGLPEGAPVSPQP